jgi:tripartite ATP-independent transporter DctM subunit
MDSLTLLVIVFGIMFLLLILGVPIAFCMFAAAMFGILLLRGPIILQAIFSDSIHYLMADYMLSVAPMFILVGLLAESSDLGSRCYQAFHLLLGQYRGGILMATTGAAAVFGACSGSTIASASLFSKIAIPEMEKMGYQEEISLGTIASAGTLATLIPPSIMAVFYGILTETSVGKVLIAGVIPGIMLTMLMMIYIYIRVILNPKIAPIGLHKIPLIKKLTGILLIWPILLIFIIIVGGIYTGTCTSSEAGALAASVVFIYNLIKRTNSRKLLNVFFDAALMTAQIFIIVIAGMLLAKLVSLTGITIHIKLLMEECGQHGQLVIWAIIILIYLILGCLMDPVSMLVITLPIFLPVIVGIGFDTVAFGIVCILMVQIAVLTPPVGFNVFVVAAAAGKDVVPVFRGSAPYFILFLLFVIIIIIFPSIATWLPNLAYG